MPIAEETIPAVVTWSEIAAHCRRDDETERATLEAYALAAIERFELETGVAGKARAVTLTFDPHEVRFLDGRLCRYAVAVPKGPLKLSPLPTVTIDGMPLDAGRVTVGHVGHLWLVQFPVMPRRSAVVSATVGHPVVPQSIKSAVLAHTEHQRVNRGVTSTQAQTEFAHGLERIYDQWRTNRIVVG